MKKNTTMAFLIVFLSMSISIGDVNAGCFNWFSGHFSRKTSALIGFFRLIPTMVREQFYPIFKKDLRKAQKEAYKKNTAVADKLRGDLLSELNAQGFSLSGLEAKSDTIASQIAGISKTSSSNHTNIMEKLAVLSRDQKTIKKNLESQEASLEEQLKQNQAMLAGEIEKIKKEKDRVEQAGIEINWKLVMAEVQIVGMRKKEKALNKKIVGLRSVIKKLSQQVDRISTEMPRDDEKVAVRFDPKNITQNPAFRSSILSQERLSIKTYDQSK